MDTEKEVDCREDCKEHFFCKIFKENSGLLEGCEDIDDLDWSTMTPGPERGEFAEQMLIGLYYLLEDMAESEELHLDSGMLKHTIAPLHKFVMNHAYNEESMAAMEEEEPEGRWVQYDDVMKTVAPPIPEREKDPAELLPDISSLNQKIRSLIKEERESGRKKKAKYVCSLCGEQGHNRRTCPIDDDA